MIKEALLKKIMHYFATLQSYIKLNSSASLYDINIFSEDILAKVLNEVYDWHLTNLNEKNSIFPGIDLADVDNRIAFQVTSTSNAKKIQHTIDQFVKNQFHNFYSLNIFILSGKKDYRSNFNTQQQFIFDASNIFDFTDIVRKLKNVSVEKLQNILNILESETALSNLETIHSEFSQLVNNILKLVTNNEILDNEILSEFDRLYANFKRYKILNESKNVKLNILYDFIKEYSSLPRVRGEGYKIENWVKLNSSKIDLDELFLTS